MTCREGSGRSVSRGAAAGSASRASSPARRARTCRGTVTRTRRSRISRRVPARAGKTSPRPATWACCTPTRSPTCPEPGRRPPSTTGTRWNAAAAAAMATPRRGGRGPGTLTYALNVQAWCVFLLVMHHVPVERCADILESMTGTRPSDGWVHALLGRAGRAVAAANKTIRALIILARVVCGDETPIRSGPGPTAKKKYLHVACTNLLTYYYLGDRDLPRRVARGISAPGSHRTERKSLPLLRSSHL